jgi:hypothetical protein
MRYTYNVQQGELDRQVRQDSQARPWIVGISWPHFASLAFHSGFILLGARNRDALGT